LTTVLAIDLGGTKILAAQMRDGRVLAERRVDTPRTGGVDAWLGAIEMLAADWRTSIDGVGAAVTGAVDGGRWYALNPATLPVPPGFPLRDALQARLGVPAIAVNDAQAAAWGEHRAGAGQDAATMVFVTISTGIGGGIVLDGRLIAGRFGIAGSVGQMRLDDGATRIEDVASGRAIARMAGETGKTADARAVFTAADAGEAWAVAILDRAALAMARLLRNVQLVLAPEVIVVGGGVGLAPGHLARIERALADIAAIERPALRPAGLDARAGIIGVASLVSGLVGDKGLNRA
jgi:predicted NBD/HSP70 family sugar kinase